MTTEPQEHAILASIASVIAAYIVLVPFVPAFFGIARRIDRWLDTKGSVLWDRFIEQYWEHRCPLCRTPIADRLHFCVRCSDVVHNLRQSKARDIALNDLFDSDFSKWLRALREKGTAEGREEEPR